MRGALIHGALLVVMLVYGYRTWTRDTTVLPDHGSVVLWDKADADLVSIELKGERKITKLERRGQAGDTYWWGLETTIEKKLKPADRATPDAGSGSAAGSGSDAGSAAGSGSAAPPAVVEEEIRKTREFPLGESGDTLVNGFVDARALRDLGKPTDAQKKDYKLDAAKATLTIAFKDGPRSFLVGGSVYGGSDRYVVDQKSGRAYVLSKELISGLELGESSLHLLDPNGFAQDKLEAVTIEGNGKSKTVVRVQAGIEQQVKTWGDPVTKKADQTIANFIDNANNLRPTEYHPEVKVADLTLVLKLSYKDARGGKLGTVQLFKREKAPELPPNTELDPANPPKSVTEYLIVTEKTRVPALVRTDTAQRTEQDIATVFSDHPTSIESKPNPLGNTPLPPPGAHGAPADPHGAPADPHGAPADPHGAPADPHGAPADPHGAPADPHGAPPRAPAAGAAPGSAAPAKAVPTRPAATVQPGAAVQPAPAKGDPPKPAAGTGITPKPAPAATQHR